MVPPPVTTCCRPRPIPTGMSSLGTMNNCGSGRTPWGTYLTCEENFNGYFGSTAEAMKPCRPTPGGFQRYGIGVEGWGYDYHKWDSRWDVARTPTSRTARATSWKSIPPIRTSTPVKHTALGRFKHENAAYAIAGRPRFVVYMGDDERGEYMYKWVSASPTWKAATPPADGRRHALRGRVRR
jgi:secreted PhoX family phosphatase